MTGEHVQVSVSAQLHLAVRKVVCVEDDMFGEEGLILATPAPTIQPQS